MILKDKSAVVAGGSRGLGLGLVEALVAHGARVTVVARGAGALARDAALVSVGSLSTRQAITARHLRNGCARCKALRDDPLLLISQVRRRRSPRSALRIPASHISDSVHYQWTRSPRPHHHTIAGRANFVCGWTNSIRHLLDSRLPSVSGSMRIWRLGDEPKRHSALQRPL
jgi:hypothetical protein